LSTSGLTQAGRHPTGISSPRLRSDCARTHEGCQPSNNARGWAARGRPSSQSRTRHVCSLLAWVSAWLPDQLARRSSPCDGKDKTMPAASTSAARTTKSRGSAAAGKPRTRRTVKAAARRTAGNGKQSQTAAASADSPKETVEENHTHSGQDPGLLGLGELALAMVLGPSGLWCTCSG
jgi:hypothetical protein